MKNKKNTILLFFITFLLFANTLFLTAQQKLSISDVLASAKNQFSLQLQKQRVDFLKNNTTKLPIVDEMQFRTETNDFELSEQRYVLRGRFHTRNQQKAQQAFQQAQIELNSIEEKILLHDLLRERYLGIIQVLYFDKLLAAKKDQKILLEDRLTVLKKSINLPKFNVTDLIDAEDQIHEAERDILKLENATDFSQQNIYRMTNGAGFLNTEDAQLIDIDDVMKIVRSLPAQPSETHAELVKRNLNITLAIREQAIRIAQEKNTFEYFQAKIGGTDDQGFKQSFSLGLGIRIPVRNTQEENLMELEFEKIDEQAKYNELQSELTERMVRIRLEIENNYRLYELLLNQLENSQADLVLKQYQKIEGASPMAMLKLKGSRFKKELEKFRIEQEIYNLYVELLDASGVIMELPLKNYLN